jgi:hypothetical protein
VWMVLPSTMRLSGDDVQYQATLASRTSGGES